MLWFHPLRPNTKYYRNYWLSNQPKANIFLLWIWLMYAVKCLFQPPLSCNLPSPPKRHLFGYSWVISTALKVHIIFAGKILTAFNFLHELRIQHCKWYPHPKRFIWYNYPRHRYTEKKKKKLTITKKGKGHHPHSSRAYHLCEISENYLIN